MEIAYHSMNSDGNFTRCYRTIYTMIGPTRIHMITCLCRLRGKHLHSSRGTHTVLWYGSEDEFWEGNHDAKHIIIEVNGEPLKGIREHLGGDRVILHFGGESVTLPTRRPPYDGLPRFKIPTERRLPLINDVVTGVVLYEVKNALTVEEDIQGMVKEG